MSIEYYTVCVKREMCKKACALFLSLIALAAYLASMEAGYFLWAAHHEPRTHSADAIVVYPLGGGRLEAGSWLLRAGYAERFCLVGTSRRHTLRLAERYGVRLPPDALLQSGSSRSTFEDALRAKQLARRKGFERVLVVTSGYHKPRSLLMTRYVFFGSGIRADVLSAGRILQENGGREAGDLGRWRREYISLWGSLLELGYYAISGRLLCDRYWG